MAHPDTIDAITAALAQRVIEARKTAGLNQAALAEKMQAAGRPWTRTTVVKFENGYRESIGVADLLALAYVLDVPPSWLLADTARGHAVPIVTGVEVDPWSAVLWFGGLQPLPGERDASRWNLAAQPMAWATEITKIVREMDGAEELRALGVAEPGYPDRGADEQDIADQNDRQRLRRLAPLLTRISERGQTAPPLSAYTLRRAKELGVDLPGIEG